MIIVHASDLHLGVAGHGGKRAQDFAARWLDCCDYVVDHAVDALIFSGDAFHTRNPEPQALNVFAQGVKRVAAAGIPVILLVGNHDLPATAGRAHALSVLHTLDVPNVTVLDHPVCKVVNTLAGRLGIYALPWPAKGWTVGAQDNSFAERDARLGAFLGAELARLAADARNTKTYCDHTILVSHIGVAEAVASSETGMMLGRETQLPLAVFREHADAFDYVALGHYHKTQMWPRERGLDGAPWIAYAGSMERVDFGEAADPKGWLRVDLDRQTVAHVEGHRTAPRRMVDIGIDCRAAGVAADAFVAEQIAQYGDLSDCIVRLRLCLRNDQIVSEGALQRALQSAWSVAPVINDIERSVRQRLGEHAETLAPSDALARYLASLPGLSADQQAALLQVGNAIMRETDNGRMQ